MVAGIVEKSVRPIASGETKNFRMTEEWLSIWGKGGKKMCEWVGKYIVIQRGVVIYILFKKKNKTCVL